MTQWALEHPWLTAIIVIFTLMVVSDTITNVARVRVARHISKNIEGGPDIER